MLSNGSGDEVRNYLYRWLVVNGQVQYANIVPPGSSDLTFDLSYIVYVPSEELGDTDTYTGESQIRENILGKNEKTFKTFDHFLVQSYL